jgi:hypothetical protein
VPYQSILSIRFLLFFHDGPFMSGRIGLLFEV